MESGTPPTGWRAVSHKTVRVGSSEEVTLKQRTEGGEGKSQGDVWGAGGRVLQAEGDSQGPCLACLRT